MAKIFTGSEADLIALYHLENVNDSKNGFNLTNNGTVTFSAAKFSNGANLGTPNTSKYLSIANSLGIDGGAITIVCWVKLLAEIGTGNWYFVWQGNSTTDVQYYIRYEYNGGTRRLYFAREGTSLQGAYYTITLGTSNFYQLALTYDTTNIRGYVNGVLVAGPTAASGNSSGYNSIFRIGLDGYGVGVYAAALIDEVAVFNAAKSESFIKSYYRAAGGAFLLRMI